MPHVIAATALLVVLGPVLQALNRSGGALSDARHSAVYLLLATVFIARAKTSSTERLLWWAFAAAQLATALASFVWKYGFDQAPWSPADALFAGKYVAFWLGLAFLLGLRLGEAAPRFWVDLGGMTVLAVAVASVFLVPSIVATSYLPAAAAVLNIGYAAASGVIAITPVTIAALTGRRIRSQDALLTAGFAVLCVADCLYALSLAGDAPSTGWAFAGYELGWEVAPLLLAAAAWARPTGAGTPKPGHPVEWIPTVILTVGGAGILVASLFAAIDKIVTLLAIGALVLAAVRGVLLSGDTRRMAIYRREALTDDLTELPNRRRLFRELELLTRDGGRSGERATLMFLGVDGFRELNDTLGHSAGDDLIFSLARRLEASAGDALLASLGSDEFALIVRGASEHASDTAERLHAALEQPFEYEDITIKLDVTIGLALFPDDASTASELARRADVAMIDAKRRHISTARYRRDRDDNSRELLALATDLRDALTQPNGGLWVAFQPQVELADGACASAEALVRWRHPQLGDISPVQLIPIAHRTSRLGALTEWVLDQSLAAVAAIHEEQHPFRISVNVSAASLVDVTFPSKIAAALGRHGLAPERLMIEVTEDAIMTDRLRCIEVLEAIRDHGVELSIDDFGTGHSSLAQVRTLPASELKIDRAFISGIASSKQDADVVKLIIALGKAVQMRVVAEGIETSEVRRLLTDYGCDIAQGFAIGRPMPVEALRQFLATTQTA